MQRQRSTRRHAFSGGIVPTDFPSAAAAAAGLAAVAAAAVAAAVDCGTEHLSVPSVPLALPMAAFNSGAAAWTWLDRAVSMYFMLYL